jgi:hypothetical protein
VHFEVLKNGHQVNPAHFVALRAGATAFTGPEAEAVHAVAAKAPPSASTDGQD